MPRAAPDDVDHHVAEFAAQPGRRRGQRPSRHALRPGVEVVSIIADQTLAVDVAAGDAGYTVTLVLAADAAGIEYTLHATAQ